MCAYYSFSPRGSFEPFTEPFPHLDNGISNQTFESHADPWNMVDRTLKFHAYIMKAVAIAGGLTTNILSSTLCRDVFFYEHLHISCPTTFGVWFKFVEG